MNVHSSHIRSSQNVETQRPSTHEWVTKSGTSDGILLRHEKNRSADVWYSMDGPYTILSKGRQTQQGPVVRFPLYETPRTSRYTETKR